MSNSTITYNDLPCAAHKLDEMGPETWQMWFIFGQSQDDPNLVDIDTPSGITVVHRIPRDKAEMLVAQRAHFLKWAIPLLQEKKEPVLQPVANQEQTDKQLAKAIKGAKKGRNIALLTSNNDWLICEVSEAGATSIELFVELPSIHRSAGKFRLTTAGNMRTLHNAERGTNRQKYTIIFGVVLPADAKPGADSIKYAKDRFFSHLYGASDESGTDSTEAMAG